jgi:hypothetical protein
MCGYVVPEVDGVGQVCENTIELVAFSTFFTLVDAALCHKLALGVKMYVTAACGRYQV